MQFFTYYQNKKMFVSLIKVTGPLQMEAYSLTYPFYQGQNQKKSHFEGEVMVSCQMRRLIRCS